MSNKVWVGFDLDGTLAHYDNWRGAGHIGEPIPYMVSLLKHLSKKYNIRIFTARVGSAYPQQIDECRKAISEWCMKHIGFDLPVTSEKDQHMIACYDDRSKQVVSNTGICLEDELSKIVLEFESKIIDIEQFKAAVVKLSKVQKI
jgi:hypothetical protein